MQALLGRCHCDIKQSPVKLLNTERTFYNNELNFHNFLNCFTNYSFISILYLYISNTLELHSQWAPDVVFGSKENIRPCWSSIHTKTAIWTDTWPMTCQTFNMHDKKKPSTKHHANQFSVTANCFLNFNPLYTIRQYRCSSFIFVLTEHECNSDFIKISVQGPSLA